MLKGAFTAPQTLFCLFYAIFWGMIANAQIAWKAFNWSVALAGMPKAADQQWKPAWHRLQQSLVILLLLQSLVFVGLLFSLRLTWIEWKVLGVWCIYCVSSQVIIALVALLALASFFQARRMQHSY